MDFSKRTLMLSRENNDLLARTGPGTVMGEVLRRYWIPALLSEELPEPDGPPVRVRLLGEDLVAFRDSRGRIGLLAEYCRHRGVSLFYGRNEESGLRCIYHGWKFDVDGRVLEMPAEPNDKIISQGVTHTAYPTVEAAGMVFAYLGPRDKMPLFPSYAWTTTPAAHTYVTKSFQECNYLYGLEGECDSSHLSFLHRVLQGPGSNLPMFTSVNPRYEIEKTDFGLRLIATRSLGEDKDYVRISSFVMPTTCWVQARNKEAHIYVPIDDAHSWRYDLGFLDRPLNDEDHANSRAHDLGPGYRKIANRANDYLQDRQKQKTKNFTGMDSFLSHDSCVTESIGPNFDRSREYLGFSDQGVVALRNALLKSVMEFQAGKELPHLVHDQARNTFPHIDTFDITVPRGHDWRAEFPDLYGGPR
jgi:phthalate 4,5-dioxygenase oxygenase subunit